MISDFQDGCLAEMEKKEIENQTTNHRLLAHLGNATLEPSARTIFFGSAISKGMAIPIQVRMMNAIYMQQSGTRVLKDETQYMTHVGTIPNYYRNEIALVRHNFP